jgi:hypothetical protein
MCCATVDGQYLHLQVALEAFAKALLDAKGQSRKPRLLVKDKKAWVRWVKTHAAELRPMLADMANEDVFVGKVIAAMNLPSSGVVADALSRLEPPLVVDDAALDEMANRNIPVHYASMNKPGVDYDGDREVARIDILRALLAALMARACGYDGALAGWVRDEAAVVWKPQPNWWPAPSAATITEARVRFACGSDGAAPPPSRRPRRPRSAAKSES